MSLSKHTLALVYCLFLSFSFLTAQNCGPAKHIFPRDNSISNVRMDKTADGGYIMVVNMNQENLGSGVDVHIIKSDAFGNEMWSRIYSWEGDDFGAGIRQVADGGYVIIGTTNSPSIADSEYNILLFKIDPVGDLLWQQAFGVEVSYEFLNFDIFFSDASEFIGNDIEVLENNDLILVGSLKIPGWPNFTEAIVMIKTDADGNVLNLRTLSLILPHEQTGELMPGSSSGYDVFLAANGDFIFTGFTWKISFTWPNDGHLSVVRTNSNLETIWESTNPFSSWGPPIGRKGLEYEDGSLFIVVSEIWTGVPHTSPNSRLVKISGDGSLLWSKYMGYSGASDIVIAPDGNLVFSKSREIIKVDTSGTIIWNSPKVNDYYGGFYGGGNNSLQTTPNGGYILSGRLGQSAVLAEFDSLGNHCINLVEGIVFVDANVDCVKDSTEMPVKNALIKLTPDNQFTNTNSDGLYRFQVDTGNYNLQTFPPNALWGVGCPLTTTYDLSVNGAYQTTADLDFGLHALENCALLNLDIGFFRARICRESNIFIHYCNEGTVSTEDVQVQVQLDETLQFVEAELPWTLMDGVYTFPIGTLDIGECGSFKVTVFVDCDAPFGEPACVSASIFPQNTCNLEEGENQDKSCRTLTNSYDPNDKLVAVNDTSDCWQTALDKLEYTIRFQNTGNDTAYHIVILDTLSSDLDLSTVRPGPSSHQYEFKVMGSNVLMFVFKEINLLDSTTNLAESQGFVQFSIHSVLDIAEGTTITNQAAIYFDSNEPVITEPVLVTQCELVPLTIIQVEKEPVTNCLAHNGQLEIQATGGEGIYEYSVDGGLNWQDSPIFDSLVVGQYEVLAKDEADSIHVYYRNPVIIDELFPTILAVEAEDPFSCGGSEGYIEFEAIGPESILYSIDGGNTFQEEAIFENLTQGEYEVIVVNECLVGDTISNIVLTDPPYPEITSIFQRNPRCEPDNGRISIGSYGVHPRYFSINGGEHWQNSNTWNDLESGDYEVLLSYGEGNCEVVYDSIITLQWDGHVYPEIQEVATIPPSTCYASDGTIEINATGNFLLFSVDGGDSFQEEPLFEQLIASPYHVIVQNGCNSLSEYITLDAPPVPSISNVEFSHPECGLNNGALSITASGSEALEYSINNGGNFQEDTLFSNLPEGNYEVLVRYTDGTCEVAYENILSLQWDGQLPPQMMEVSSADPSLCNVSDGTIEVNAIGPMLNFSINGGDSFQEEGLFEQLAADTYNIVIQNDCGILDTTLILQSPPVPSIHNVTLNDPDCGLDNGTLSITASGGEALEYSLNSEVVFQSDPLFINLPAGVYEINIRNIAICYADSLLVELTAPAPPMIQDLILIEPDCQDMPGSIEIIAESEEPLIFSINGGTNWHNTANFDSLPIGSYDLVVSNSTMTCMDTAIQNPVQFYPPLFPIIDSLTIVHPVHTSMSNGSLVIHGSGAETLLFSLDEGITWQLSNLFSNLSPGNYEAWIAFADTTCVAIESNIELSPLTGTITLVEKNIIALNVYPNPSSAFVNIVLELSEFSNVKWKLISILGSTVFTAPMVKTKKLSETISTAHFPKGVYCLQLEINGNRIIRRLVVN